MNDRKILMVSNFSNHNKQVVDLTIQNHYNYCAKYNIDFLYTISQYSPRNNTQQLRCLFGLYDTIITVGTDILFTNFDKDIRDFIDYSYPIIMQQQRIDGIILNGDFIIWNKTDDIQNKLNSIQKNQNKYKTSQELFSVHAEMFNIKKLPPRTIQSISKYGTPDDKLMWQKGDFSVHCHRQQVAPLVQLKVDDLSRFIKDNQNLILSK